MTAADRPYGKFYDFYSVGLETFGSTHVCHIWEIHTQRIYKTVFRCSQQAQVRVPTELLYTGYYA